MAGGWLIVLAQCAHESLEGVVESVKVPVERQVPRPWVYAQQQRMAPNEMLNKDREWTDADE